ncbi:hypothetical protein KVR01_013770 [Diaporthe batatas]|uniref:uncharacterized protein n=1 Tax=Diaporthe batatas TaxID=748121 RepID=UPI001D0597AF|nr:uncharacterized protein KVR01_013770 [Diaporthe batatas]KAG8156318.1 hypothetical protein KVR01_013770 [Diaporthe batatas]
MASPSSNNPSQGVTFGVELEMAVPFLFFDQPDPAEGMDMRKVIRVSRETKSPRTSFREETPRPENILEGIFKEFLRGHGLAIWDPTMQGKADQAISPPTGWFIGIDTSIHELKFAHYNWVGLELRSPAMLANETSFAEIKRVVSLLRTSFRLRVNETTGLHVHVGLGAQRLPPRAIIRLVQLLWCADGTLSQLHPPERFLSPFCPSIRHDSVLARRLLDDWRGTENLTVGGGLAITPLTVSAALTDRLKALLQAPTSFPALDSRPNTSRLQRLPPVRTNPYEDAGAQRRYGMLNVFGGGRPHRDFLLISRPAEGITEETCLPVLDGLRALCRPEMYEKATRAVDEIQINSMKRANYNCNAYGFQHVGGPPMRMTVEFREAAGSLDPSWVAAWARITSRIVEFCLEAEEDEFVELLMRVLEAELAFEANGGVSRYDVVDFLHDLGLPDEARFVEENIIFGDKASFWFPCALSWSQLDDQPGATIMMPTEYEN